MSADQHALERTSPKGPGQAFVGRCMKCGKTGLTFADIGEPCVNPSGMTQGEALIEAIIRPSTPSQDAS